MLNSIKCAKKLAVKETLLDWGVCLKGRDKERDSDGEKEREWENLNQKSEEQNNKAGWQQMSAQEG